MDIVHFSKEFASFNEAVKVHADDTSKYTDGQIAAYLTVMDDLASEYKTDFIEHSFTAKMRAEQASRSAKK